MQPYVLDFIWVFLRALQCIVFIITQTWMLCFMHMYYCLLNTIYTKLGIHIKSCIVDNNYKSIMIIVLHDKTWLPLIYEGEALFFMLVELRNLLIWVLTDNSCFFLQALIEFDDSDWQQREWIRIHSVFQVFLVEQTVVWSERLDPENKSTSLEWPALVCLLHSHIIIYKIMTAFTYILITATALNV